MEQIKWPTASIWIVETEEILSHVQTGNEATKITEKVKCGENFLDKKYRNRRIGEIFKELDLSEKQSTGIPTILNELKKNGSPMPEFDTDDERNYLETTIKIRDGFTQADKMSDKQKTFYRFLIGAFKTSEFVTTKMMAESTTRRYLNQFCEMQIIKSDGENKGTKYYLI